MKKVICLALLTLCAAEAHADFNIDNPLNFGEIAIRNNTVVSSLVLSRNGAEQSTNQIFIIHQGTPGVFTLSGFSPYTTVNLSVDLPAYSSMAYPNTAQFKITAVDLPSSLNLGPTGSGQFSMGATLTTSGNPAENYYSGADYIIFLNLNINY